MTSSNGQVADVVEGVIDAVNPHGAYFGDSDRLFRSKVTGQFGVK